MTIKWTDAKIKGAKLAPGKTESRAVIDGGLFLRLRASGNGVSKTFEYRAQVNRQRRYLALGPVSDAFGLHQARQKLQELRTVAAQARIGESDHPAIVERFKRAGKRSDPTFNQLFELFIGAKELGSPRKDGKPVRARTIFIHRHNYDSDIRPLIGDARVATITREALQACVNAPLRRSAPGMAAQVYRTLRALIRFAIEQGRLGVDPMAGMHNPKPYRAPRSAEDVVAANDVQLVALFRVLSDSDVSEPVQLAIELQLLTGARPSEVRMARLHEFNAKAASWTIPAERNKADRTFEIHLSEQAVELVRGARKLPRLEDHMFPGQRGIAMDKMAVARALARISDRVIEAGGRKLRPHDLRRTTRTMMSRLGVAPHIAERCLGHLQADVLQRVYDGHDHHAEMAEAWDKVGAHIAALRRSMRPSSAVMETSRNPGGRVAYEKEHAKPIESVV